MQTDDEGCLRVAPGDREGAYDTACAHLDTVFPAGTDVSGTEKDGKLHAPGISDDAGGLEALLGVVLALNDAEINTTGDIVSGGTVGEEGLGDLRGVKAMFVIARISTASSRSMGPASGTSPTSPPGPIAMNDLSRPRRTPFHLLRASHAIHAIGRAIAAIGELITPTTQDYLYRRGRQRRHSVNSIAAEARLLIDMRSNREAELLALEEQFSTFSNRRRPRKTRAGQRPDQLRGQTRGEPSCRSSALRQRTGPGSLGLGAGDRQEPSLGSGSSTDSNVPISLGIPAVTLGRGGKEDNRPCPERMVRSHRCLAGTAARLLTILGLMGVEGSSAPRLPRRKR